MSIATILRISWAIFISGFVQCRSLKLEYVAVETRWDQASSSCKSFGSEYELAMVKNEQTMSEINAFIATIPSPPENFWMGLFWNITTRQFFWIDNELHELGVDYEIWKSSQNEPNDMQTSGTIPGDNLYQNCVCIHEGEWKTMSCLNTYFVLCMEVQRTTEAADLTTSPIVSVITTTSVPDHDTTSVTSPVSSVMSTTIYTENTSLESLSKTSTENVDTYPELHTTEPADQTTSPIVSVRPTTSAVPDHDITSPGSSVVSTTMYTDNTSRDPTQSSMDSYATSTVPAGSRAIVYCPHDALTLCDCEVVKNVSKGSNMSIAEYVFKVDNKKTRAYLNNHYTVNDERLSAKMIGGTGLVILLSVVSMIVCSDLIGLNQNKFKKKCNLPCSR